MDDQREPLPPVPASPDESTSAKDGATEQEAAGASRRRFLGESARKLAYAAPIVMLFKPTPAMASGGSQIS